MSNVTWHRGIGSEITSDMSIDDQLEIAGLNWEVATSEIKYGSNFEKQSDFKKALYRTDNGILLDTCGKNWKPYQNKELVQAFHQFCTTANLTVDHLGSLDNGRIIFAGAELPREINVGNVGDIVRGRILLFNFHKVGYGLSVRVQMERLVCTNGLTEPVRVGQKTINHVSAFDSIKVERILQSAFDNFSEFGTNAEKLANTQLKADQAALLLIKEFGNSKLPVDQQPAIVSNCLDLFFGGAKGSDYLSAYNTAWGLLNSVTEYFNHHSQIRGGTSTHLNSLLLGSKANKQQQFYQQLVRICK